MFQGVFNSINKGIKNIIGGSTNKYSIKGKDYNEVSLVGEGGFGYVYEVEDAMTGEKYALKKMNITDKGVLENIKKEIDVWIKINNSPNIVKLIDYEFSPQYVSILMELCNEGNLFKLITNNEKNFPEKEVLQIIYESAKGIYAMHSQNPPIAHRDIKIENILKKGNNYKLCDFGSSTTKTIDPKKEEKNIILDQFSSFDKFTTFMYRPPEMCDQYSKYLINEKVDIWMLGCVFYAIMFKKHPFQDSQKLAIINAHYYIPDEDADKYSEKSIDFMRLMLTPNPSLRPSIADVLNILKSWNTLAVIQLNDEVKEIKAKQLKNKKSNNGLNLLSPEDILKVQEQIKKDQMKKKRYFKNINDDDFLDNTVEVGDDDIGEQKYSNIPKNKSTINKNTNNDNSNFNNLTNTFSNSNNQGPEYKTKQQIINPIWDFDFGSNTSKDNNEIANSNQHNNNFSDFQFFDNNSNLKNNAAINTKNDFHNKVTNQGSNKNNQSSAMNNFTFDFNNTNISNQNNNNSKGFEFDFMNSKSSNNSNNNNSLNKNLFNFDFSNESNNNQPNPGNFNSKSGAKNIVNKVEEQKGDIKNLQNQNIFDFFK